MAIKETIAWLQNQIPDDAMMDHLRKKLGSTNKHIISYPQKWVYQEMSTTIRRAAKEVYKAAGGTNSKELKKEFRALNQLVQKYQYRSYQKAYRASNIVHKYRQNGLKIDHSMVNTKSRDAKVEIFANPKLRIDGVIRNKKGNLVNALHQANLNLLKEAVSDLTHRIRKDPDATKNAKGLMISSKKKKEQSTHNFLGRLSAQGLHGAPSGDLNPNNVAARDDTTVGLIGFGANIESEVSDFIENASVGKKLAQETLTEIDGYFDSKWKVNNKKFSDMRAFRDKIEIVLLIGPSVKNPLMRYADRDGIQDYLEEIRDEMLRQFEKVPEGEWDAFADKKQSKKTLRQRAQDNVEEATVTPLVKNLKKNKNLKVTTKGLNRKSSTTRETTKGTGGQKLGAKAKRSRTTKPSKGRREAMAIAGGAATKAKRRKSQPGQASSDMNPIGLQQLLNKTLPAEVVNNMGPYPRKLENRTGRFAQSAQVTQVVPMPRSVEIRYTYQKDPYAVFEPEFGNPLASRGRDPKHIIGGTIREIAQEIMGTKYGLVRTKRV